MQINYVYSWKLSDDRSETRPAAMAVDKKLQNQDRTG